MKRRVGITDGSERDDRGCEHLTGVILKTTSE